MLIKYLGPSPAINVGVDGKVRVHVKDTVEEYPDEVGEDLLLGKKNNFEAVAKNSSPLTVDSSPKKKKRKTENG